MKGARESKMETVMRECRKKPSFHIHMMAEIRPYICSDTITLQSHSCGDATSHWVTDRSLSSMRRH